MIKIMKSLTNYISEKLVITKDYMKHKYKYYPKTPQELRQIILNRYDKQGPGTKTNPVDFNDINISQLDSLCYKIGNFYSGSIGIFENTKFEYIDVSDWDVSKIKDMCRMFNECSNLKSVGDLSSWEVSKVKDMCRMFRDCSSLKEIDLSNWDVSNVTNMYNMFRNCKSLQKLNISNWDVSNVTDMEYMFFGCNEEIIPDWYDWYKE